MELETPSFTKEMTYSIDELNSIINTYIYSKLDNSYLGNPVYKCEQDEPISGEVFRTYLDYTKSREDIRSFLESEEIKTYKIEVSNLGRIKINGEIKKQFQETYGYLYVNVTKSVKYHVYRFVAETWLKCPVGDTLYKNDGKCWIVHHISDNGFDNRPSNLIWMSKDDHNKIGHRTHRDNELARQLAVSELEKISINGDCKDKVIELIEDICLIGKKKEKTLIDKLIQLYDINIDEYAHIKWDRYI